VALTVLGILCRTGRYLRQFPIWGDEAFICLNLLERGYRELLQPLRFGQVAPLLFLWGEATVYRVLGSTELALRLLPFLAGLGSLMLFWRLAWLALPPRAGLLALGIMAVAYYPVRHSCEVKPYAFDLFVSLSLLVIAVSWLREPTRLLWPVMLALVVPVALGLSYPAVFIAGAVSLTLLPTISRQPGWTVKLLYLTCNLLMGVSFLTYYWLLGLGQHASMDKVYWESSFPPVDPVSLRGWLWQIHTGSMFAYPVGGHAGGSALTFLLCLLGVWQLGRSRRWHLLALLLVPFALTMIAAALHRYPYGGSARVAQHLAPAICLLAGTGLAAVTKWIRWPTWSQRGMIVACTALALVGAGALVRDSLKPYKTVDDRSIRHFVGVLLRRAAWADQIVIMDPSASIHPTLEWYLRRGGNRVSWDGRIDCHSLGSPTEQLWCVYFDPSHAAHDLASLAPGAVERRITLADHRELELRSRRADGTPEYCAVHHWVCVCDVP
jgi:4-amino-4-deoxy-L-arabinose transferase-like glycosyltransferase